MSGDSRSCHSQGILFNRLKNIRQASLSLSVFFLIYRFCVLCRASETVFEKNRRVHLDECAQLMRWTQFSPLNFKERLVLSPDIIGMCVEVLASLVHKLSLC